MATSAVYQPTTVSFETSPGLLHQTQTPIKRIIRKPIIQVSFLVLGLLFLAAGIVMIAGGAADYSDVEAHKEEVVPEQKAEEEIDIGVIIGGTFMVIIGFVLLGFYIKVADWRRSCVCPCGISKKQGLARQLQGQSGGGQALALNPSTDPLVSHTQYAPVSEIPREDEERRNLMANDNKDCLSSAEESDRMLETSDPRIVLRPIGHVDDA